LTLPMIEGALIFATTRHSQQFSNREFGGPVARYVRFE
jgi:hypothetical protein